MLNSDRDVAAELASQGFSVIDAPELAQACRTLNVEMQELFEQGAETLQRFQLFQLGIERGYFPSKSEHPRFSTDLVDGSRKAALDGCKEYWYGKRRSNPFPSNCPGVATAYDLAYSNYERLADTITFHIAEWLGAAGGRAKEEWQDLFSNTHLSRGDQSHALVALHYPGYSADPELAELWLRSDEHCDNSVFSIVPLSAADDLEVKIDGQWVSLNRSSRATPNSVVIMVGNILQLLTKSCASYGVGSVFNSVPHRVRGNSVAHQCDARFNSAFFVTLPDEISLTDLVTKSPLPILDLRPSHIAQHDLIPSTGLGLAYMVQKPVWRSGISFHEFAALRSSYSDHIRNALRTVDYLLDGHRVRD
jgi:isopenicillin N synthase-like dioxygenase